MIVWASKTAAEIVRFDSHNGLRVPSLGNVSHVPWHSHPMMCCKHFALVLCLIPACLNAFSAQDTREITKLEKQLINAHGGKEADLRARLAKALALQASDEYKRDDVQQAEALLREALSETAQATAVAIAVRSKEKTVEIRLREISRILGDVARSVPFENRAHIEHVRQSVEELRTKLLDHMFKKK